MGQSTDGYDIDARFRHSANARQRYIATGFEPGTAVCLRAVEGNRLLHGLIVHIVEHDDVCARIQRLPEFVEIGHFNFHLHEVVCLLSGPFKGRANRARSGNVVFLDEHTVRKVVAMIASTAMADGRFFQGAQ